MEKNKTLREQEAPEKNTDRAFVKVNRDGSPSTGRDKKPNPAEKDKKGRRKDR